MTPKWWPFSRDVILFFSGLGGVLHETVLSNAQRPTLLFLFASMLGLPLVLHRDEARREANGT